MIFIKFVGMIYSIADPLMRTFILLRCNGIEIFELYIYRRRFLSGISFKNQRMLER